MMMFKTNDGTVIRAKDAADFVRQLHETSMTPAPTDTEFMAEVAERTMTLTVGASKIRWDSPEAFLTDLLKLGLVQQIN